tara:strand:- start:65033 stop:66916 length:1884 start_codon:yes stop_codon:yes gene_type:complete
MLKKKNTIFIRRTIIFIIVFAIFSLLISVNAFSNIQSSITDNLQGNKQVLNNIVIIKIDDESINNIGRWPWNRDVFAQILEKVESAKVIGADLSFFEESSNDSSLRTILEEMNNTVLAAEVNGDILYGPIFDSDFGYVNLIADNDGVVRSLRKGVKDEVLPFSFEIYQKAFNDNKEFPDGIYRINFASSPNEFNSISVLELLTNEPFDFENKFVFIGATANNLHDTFIVPTSDGIFMPGVEVQAHIFQNVLLDNFIEKQKRFVTFFIVLLFGILGFFFFSRLKIYNTIFLVLGIIIIYSFLGIFIFNKYNYVIDFFFLPLALIIFTGTGIGVNYLEEQKHSKHLTNAFGKYVSKDLLAEIIDYKHDLNLGGQKKNITLFFSDIRGFTTISEKLSPEKLSSLINRYLTEMTKIILDHGGTLDKFIGDAIMAFWNAPIDEKNHASLACKSAISQIKTLKYFNKSLKKEKLPPLQIGCGLHTGDAVVGNFGSEDRFDYTALGDAVNTAARLEGLTKYYGVDIIISESTHLLIKKELKCMKLDMVKVKGKEKPISIYELCIDHNEDFINQYEKALELYFERKFKEALKNFKFALKLRKEDKSCKRFIERCEEYIKSPPSKNWKGAFEMKTK